MLTILSNYKILYFQVSYEGPPLPVPDACQREPDITECPVPADQSRWSMPHHDANALLSSACLAE